MRAAVFYEVGKPLVVENVELGSPRAGEVLVRIAATGVCHSDLHYIKGDLTMPLPVVLGHEAAGVVEGLGPGVDSVKVGRPRGAAVRAGVRPLPVLRQRPAAPVRDALPRPRQDAGRHVAAARAAAANSITSRASRRGRNRRSCPRPGCCRSAGTCRSASPRCSGCAVTTGVGAVVNTARVPPGSTVAVFGLGGVGLNVVQGARIAGAVQIIGVDVLGAPARGGPAVRRDAHRQRQSRRSHEGDPGSDRRRRGLRV